MSNLAELQDEFERTLARLARIMETSRPAGRHAIRGFAETFEDDNVLEVGLLLTKSQERPGREGRLAICEAQLYVGSGRGKELRIA